MTRWILLLFAVLLGPLSVDAAAQSRYVCTTPVSGACDGNSPGYSTLQSAVTAAVAGDTIYVTAGQTFTDSVELPAKAGCSTWDCIIITTSTTMGLIPPAGDRACPEDEDAVDEGACEANLDPALYPTVRATHVLASSNEPALYVQSMADNYGWTFRRIRVTNGFNGGGVGIRVGTSDTGVQNTRAEQPAYITIDQVYFDYDTDHPYWGQRRAIECHSGAIRITNNYIQGVNHPSSGTDAQAIWCHNGEGPYVITNNWIRGATYGFLVGGEAFGIRTLATVTGTPTTTTASLTWSAGVNPTGDCPFIGQRLAIEVDGQTGLEWPTVTDVDNCVSGAADVTWTPALSGTIDNPGKVSWGVTPGDNALRAGGATYGLEFRQNAISRRLAWRNAAIIPAPTSPAASNASGSLSSATYSVQVVAVATMQGVVINSAPSEAVDVVVSSGGIAWSVDAMHADVTFRVYYSTGGTTRMTTATSNSGTVTAAGTITTVPSSGTQRRWKNLFEIKALIKPLVEQNYFFNSWSAAAGDGTAIWWKATNQEATDLTPNANNNTPWVQNQEGIFRDNVIRSVPKAFKVSGQEFENGFAVYRPIGTYGLRVSNILIYDHSTTTYGGSGGSAFYFGASCSDCSVEHVTVDSTAGVGLLPDSQASSSRYLSNGFTFKNSLMTRPGGGGIKASGIAEGLASINGAEGTGGGAYDVGYILWGNQASGPSSSTQGYPNHNVSSPVGNVFTAYATWQAIFQDATANTVLGYKLDDESPYLTAASDGGPLGVEDIDQLHLYMLAALSGLAEIDPEDPPPVDEDPYGPGPTRFYLSRQASEITPTITTGFDKVTSLAWYQTAPNRKSTSMAEATVSVGTATNPEFHALGGFLSEPLLEQVISGTLSCQVRGRTNNVDHHPTVAIAAYIVNADATVIKHTLLAPTASDTLASPPAFLASGSVNRNRSCHDPADDGLEIALTQGSAEEGDRLLFVVGAKDHSTSSASATAVFGDNSEIDLDPSDTGSTANNPWVQITDSVRFLEEVARRFVRRPGGGL